MNIVTRISKDLFVRTELTGSGLYMTYAYTQTDSHRHLYVIEGNNREYYLIVNSLVLASNNHLSVCKQMQRRAVKRSSNTSLNDLSN